MSQNVTITRQMEVSQTVTLSAVHPVHYVISRTFNYLKTWAGICKLIQLALGITSFVISDKEFGYYHNDAPTHELFFLLITGTFTIGTLILFLTSLKSLPTASDIPRTIYEFIYHSFGCGLLLTASLILLGNLVSSNTYMTDHKILLTASVCCLVNSVLYLVAAVFGYYGYKSD